MRYYEMKSFFHWREGQSTFWQVIGVLLSWLYIVGLHAGNDGLWYQGDAPRHAANGIFWWDILTNFPVNPIEYALQYYARYPVINPVSYPPGFYILEGVSYSLFGISPFVSKGIVLVFALVGGLYMTAWLRRWVSEGAGWGGTLLMVQPGMIVWANAVMLNVPAMVLTFATIYHTRRWLESHFPYQIYTAACLALIAIGTYFPAGIVVVVMIAWMLFERRWDFLFHWKFLSILFLSALVLLSVRSLTNGWDFVHVNSVVPSISALLVPERWTYYFWRMPYLISVPVLCLLPLSSVAGIDNCYWKREAKYVAIWSIIFYASLSFITSRSTRYGLFLVPPVMILSIGGLYFLVRRVAARFGARPSQCFAGVMVILLALLVWRTSSVRVPRVDGFSQAFAFIEEQEAEGRIFYDGQYDGVFSFYVRAGDIEFTRGVVRGSKLLYASAIFWNWRLIQRVSSPAEVVDLLRKECGCKWLVIERGQRVSRIAASRYLREAVEGPEFQFVKSFPLVGASATRLDVYRFLLPIEEPGLVELHFPILGRGTVFRVRPLLW